jgi:glycine/D-amino acid oxidase-like deaminating enzyme
MTTRSLWSATAAEPAPPAPPLEGTARADVAIVGGGFTGLSAALHLAEAGTSALVLEAEGPGFGASGRNGGQVIPGLKYDPDELVAMFGPERGERIAEIAGVGLSCVSIKATTTEGLGFTGRREGIAAQAVASIRMGSAG